MNFIVSSIFIFIIICLFNNYNCIECPIEYNTCKCEEHQEEFSIKIDCSSSNEPLYEIPKINTTIYMHLNLISYLDLSKSLIKEIQTDAFQGMTRLTTLIITKCEHLTKINMFAFRGLKSLKNLIITNNAKLEQIDAHAFGNLRNLNLLSLKYNSLYEIDGYIFSTSNSISKIELVGNPISKIKSQAFHGLRNVTDLVISTIDSKTPIKIIEADSFISTAFVENIFLQAIPCRVLYKNSFRGLSNTRLVDFSYSHIEEIQANAFYHAINIDTLNLSHCKIKTSMFNSHAFRGMHAIKEIDLRGNYISSLNEAMLSQILADFSNQSTLNKKIYFDRNPIKCDCNLSWILNNTNYLKYISLPEICAGPPGYDCLRISELVVHNLPCFNLTPDQTPCTSLFIKYNKQNEFISNKNIIDTNNKKTVTPRKTTKAKTKILKGNGDEEGREEKKENEVVGNGKINLSSLSSTLSVLASFRLLICVILIFFLS